GRGRREVEGRHESLSGSRSHAVQCRERVAPEPHRVVVCCVERKPGHGTLPGPVGEEGTLAEPGWRAEHNHAACEPLVKFRAQTRTGDKALLQGRREELRREQRVVSASGGVRRECPHDSEHRAPNSSTHARCDISTHPGPDYMCRANLREWCVQGG